MWEDAAVDFVHAMTNRPRGTAILLGLGRKRPSPEVVMTVVDHNGGVDAWTNLRPYLVTMDPAVRRAGYERKAWLRSLDFARRLGREALAASEAGKAMGGKALRRTAGGRKHP